MKILLVEDQQESRRNLSRLIEARGHEVVAFGTAEEAEAAFVVDQFPFVILDWMLPGKSGVELCRYLRALPKGDEIFVLLITARTDTGDLQMALEAGANDYLTKPLDLGRLNVRLTVAERHIRNLAERNQSRAALQESARTMANILENTTDGFFSVNRRWEFTYLNPVAEKLLGYHRSELLGKKFWEKFPELLGTDTELNYRKVMADQMAVEFEAGDSTGNVWFEMHAYPSGGGISVFFRDVTERKRNEEERLTTSKLESLGHACRRDCARSQQHSHRDFWQHWSGASGDAVSVEQFAILSFEGSSGRATRRPSLQPIAHLFQGRRTGQKSRLAFAATCASG